MKQKVVSYSLWGSNPFYTVNFDLVVAAHWAVWGPDWEFRLHHDKTAMSGQHWPMMQQAADLGLIRLVLVDEPPVIGRAMLWRLKPAFDPDVSVCVCRDLDSIAVPRDRDAVEEWMASDAIVHGINDSVSHDIALMGGMTAVKAAEFRRYTFNTWDEMVGCRPNLSQKGDDQLLLQANVFPRVAPRTLVHTFTFPRRYGAAAIRGVPQARSTTELTASLNRLMNHLGAAGYSADVARDLFARSGTVLFGERAGALAQLTRKPGRFAILSCSANRDYAVYLPSTAMTWRRAGYEPVVFIVDKPKWDATGQLSFALKALEKLGVRCHYLSPLEGHHPSTVAQVARVFAAAHPYFRSDDYLMTADADMWVLSPDRFMFHGEGRLDPAAPFHVLFANAYLEKKFPICYLGGKASVWKTIMQIPNMTLASQLDAGLGRGTTGMTAWLYDEELFAVRFYEWAGHSRAQLLNRPAGAPPADRIDRSAWPTTFDVAGKMDAHLVRLGPAGQHWPKLRPLYAKVFGDPASHDEYIANFYAQPE